MIRCLKRSRAQPKLTPNERRKPHEKSAGKDECFGPQSGTASSYRFERSRFGIPFRSSSRKTDTKTAGDFPASNQERMAVLARMGTLCFHSAHSHPFDARHPLDILSVSRVVRGGIERVQLPAQCLFFLFDSDPHFCYSPSAFCSAF